MHKQQIIMITLDSMVGIYVLCIPLKDGNYVSQHLGIALDVIWDAAMVWPRSYPNPLLM